MPSGPVTQRARLLVLIPMSEGERGALAANFDLIDPDAGDAIGTAAAVLTNSRVGFDLALFDACRSLELVHFLGSGSDGIDLAEAARRGVRVTTADGAHGTSVAEHAVTLLLAMLRGIPRYDRDIRAGQWIPLPPPIDLAGRRVGLLGFGHVGQATARLVEGFGAVCAYHARHERASCDQRYFDDPAALAAWCDDLIVTLPGDETTRHLVEAGLLDRLGPAGHLVSIGRGSVIDTVALIRALEDGRIKGAALDVLEMEPEVPARLRALDAVFITPHVGGTSARARALLMATAVKTLLAHFPLA